MHNFSFILYKTLPNCKTKLLLRLDKLFISGRRTYYYDTKPKLLSDQLTTTDIESRPLRCHDDNSRFTCHCHVPVVIFRSLYIIIDCYQQISTVNNY